jgi:hypothetical protein
MEKLTRDVFEKVRNFFKLTFAEIVSIFCTHIQNFSFGLLFVLKVVFSGCPITGLPDGLFSNQKSKFG